MTPRPLARIAAAASIVTLATLLAACAPNSTEDPKSEPSQSSSPDAGASTPPSGKPGKPGKPAKPAPVEATCENIVSEHTLEQFTTAQWTVKSHEFMIGETRLPRGAYCVWGDYNGPASDNVAIFGWSPTTEKEATAAQDELIAAGWLREDGNHGTYITEDPAYAIGIDDAGYGMTYHFGDGWVSVSETKQNLQLINAPRA